MGGGGVLIRTHTHAHTHTAFRGSPTRHAPQGLGCTSTVPLRPSQGGRDRKVPAVTPYAPLNLNLKPPQDLDPSDPPLPSDPPGLRLPPRTPHPSNSSRSIPFGVSASDRRHHRGPVPRTCTPPYNSPSQ